MLNYDFLKIINDYVRIYKKFPLPVVICDLDFKNSWSNATAQSLFFHLTEKGDFSDAFRDFDTESIRQQTIENGNYVMEEFSPFSEISVNFNAIIKDGETIGFILIFVNQSSVPTAKNLFSASKTAQALTSSLRISVNDILNTIDNVSIKMQVAEVDCLKPTFDKITFNGYKILRTASNIDVYTNIKSGTFEISPKLIDVYDLMRSMEETVEAICAELLIPIEFNLPRGKAFIQLDPVKFQIAFFNILHNSLYFTKKDNKIIVKISKKNNNDIEISVSDKGLGIKKENLEFVKKPYVSFLKEGKSEGVGLGLAVAEKIVEMHGGKLSVTSKYGHSTKTTILLPQNDMPKTLTLNSDDKVRHLNDVVKVNDRFSYIYTGLYDAALSPCSDLNNN